MIGLLGRNVRLGLVFGLLALSAGCFDEKTTVTVLANGGGTVHVSRTFTEDFTTKNYSQKTDAEKQEAASRSFLTSLKACEGIVAWSSASGKVEGGHLLQDAVGYFTDVSKVKLTDVMGTAPPKPTFTWKKNADGGFSLGWGPLSSDDDGSKTFEKKPTAEEKEQEKAAMEAYKGLSIERTLVMPGKIATASGAFTGRSLSQKVTLDDVIGFNAFVAESWAKIDKKETTKEAATAALKERLKKFGIAMDATCGPPADATEVATFEKDLAKAKAAYVGSELEKKITGK
jgi:hypothetical protein